MNKEIPRDVPLGDWEIALLREMDEEERRPRDDGGNESGEREPRRPGPFADSGAAIAPDPDGDALNESDQ